MQSAEVSSSPGHANTLTPLYVDLDGTLIRSDLLVESAFKYIRTHAMAWWNLIVWTTRGKSVLKANLAERVDLDIETLPYDPEVVAWLRDEKARGRRLVLATASNRTYAERIAAHLGCFDRVLASSSTRNLSGSEKLQAIKDDSGGSFSYAGNANVDLKVWEEASEAVVVSGSSTLAEKASRHCRIEKRFSSPRVNLRVWSKALRTHQWAKNLLIFLPALPILRQVDAPHLTAALFGFVCFGLCASSVYVLNDLLDLESDRLHPRKRNRPIPAGKLPLEWAMASVPLLLVSAGVLATFVGSWKFCGLLGFYWLSTLAYSLALKRIAAVDVMVLAGLYTLRILAGAAAIDVAPSFWILAFSMFLFLSLACLKRTIELQDLEQRLEKRASGRGYVVSDKPMVLVPGIGAGLVSVLVLALYVNDPVARSHFHYPKALWILCPLMLFWVMQIWMKAHRGEVDDDPVVYALTDRASQLVFLGSVAVVAIAFFA